jgi:hypothetical protein
MASTAVLKFSYGGVVMAMLHVAILAATVVQILAIPDASWTSYWLIFLALDFPLSLGVVPLAWMFPAASDGPLGDFPNFWWPLAYHGLLGTLWWYIVGSAIAASLSRWLGKRRERS